MTKTYNEFIYENITRSEYDILSSFGVRISLILDNKKTGLVDINQKFNISYKKLTEIPDMRLGKINGDFNCNTNKLTTLKHSPRVVRGNFHCNENLLTSLEHCPRIITGSVYCQYNNITSLEHCPKSIPGHLVCTNNFLTSLEHCPRYIGGNFNCVDNKLDESIENYPLCIIKQKIFSRITRCEEIVEIIKANEEIFQHLLDDKIKFHQMIMRLEPSLVKYYKNIPSPSKNSMLLL